MDQKKFQQKQGHNIEPTKLTVDFEKIMRLMIQYYRTKKQNG